MADTKISALTALTGSNVDAAADLLPIVDTSVSTTKSILVSEFAIAIGTAAAATQAQMETATANTVMATPLNTKWHPGVAKAWCKADAAGGVTVGRNMTSVTDDGVGAITFNVDTDFSSADWSGNVHALLSGWVGIYINITAQAAGTLSAKINNGGNDPVAWFFQAFGDQA